MIGNAWVGNLSDVGGFQSAPGVADGTGGGFWASVAVMPIRPGLNSRSIFGNFAAGAGYGFTYNPGGGQDTITANVGTTAGSWQLTTTLTSVRSQALCLMLFVGAGAEATMELYINGVLVSSGDMAAGESYTANAGVPLLVQNDDGFTPFLYLGGAFYNLTASFTAERAYYMVQQTGVYDIIEPFSQSAGQKEDIALDKFWVNAWNARDLYTGGLQLSSTNRLATVDTWPARHGGEDLTLIDPAVPGDFFTNQHTQWYQPSLGQAPTAAAFIS